MLWIEMLMALMAIVALDLANSARPVVVRRRASAQAKDARGRRGASDDRIRSARNS